MSDGNIYAVGMREQREALGMTQRELAEEVGTTTNHIYRIESRKRPVSFSLSLRCAKLFRFFRIEMDGVIYTLSPDGSTGSDGDKTRRRRFDVPTTEEHENLDGVAHAVNTRNEMIEAVEALDHALGDVRNWLRRCDGRKAERVQLVKQCLDAHAALGGILEELDQEIPDEVEEGRRLHLEERGLLSDHAS